MSRDSTGTGTNPVALDALEMDGSELLGSIIDGRYQLECILGRGGMGLVYRAAHLGLRRQVAVKILHPSLAASGDVRNRFEREAFAAGKIDHPNCINVMDSGKLPDGSRYLSMELLDGKALGDVLEAEGQIAPGRALHILAHILRGLGHIHGAGLIHRDIKPENIFLIRQGQDEDFAKILDFGIAKGMGKTDLEEGVKLTQAGMAFGTPIYMAPEQALGNPMDGRADLYAAAVLAYEMLCGQPPFYSDDKLEVMSMHTARPVPPMRQRMIKNGRAVPSSIERLIVRGLTKKPSERYASAEIFLAAVENALRTPDGGVTDVSFERAPSAASTTGSQPLITDEGDVRITGANEFVAEGGNVEIADAIEDVLTTTTPPPQRVVPAVGAGPALGLKKRTISTPPRGGVGLGLPYTGPQGEPIFGLTPEQRLSQASLLNLNDRSSIASALEPDETAARTRPVVKPTRKRWPIYAAIALVAIAAGVVIAVLTLPGSNDDNGPDPSSPAGQAYAEYKRGEPGKAIDILEANKSTTENDPDAQLVLGHAHSAKFERIRALAAYGRALTLQPEIEADEEMRTNLRTMAADDDGNVVATAFELWIRTADPEAKKALLNAAVSEKLPRRHAVVPVIEHNKLDGSVEWWRAYSLDLQQEPACPKRKEAVGKLRALGDPRGITALEQAVERRARGAPKGRYNWCLLDDAKAAIGALSALPKKP
jgi:serine/threonine-protein kinase